MIRVGFQHVLRPQVLLALLICLISIFVALRPQVKVSNEPVEILTQPNESIRRDLEITLFDERLLEKPLFVSAEFEDSAAGLARALLKALQSQTSTSVWPETLTLGSVFEAQLQGQAIVLDFNFEATDDFKIDVVTEWRLLKSIKETFIRNGISNLHILVNQEESERFLQHLSITQTQ